MKEKIKSYDKASLSELEKLDSEKWSIHLEDFYAAYKECRRNKRTTDNAIRFELDYEKNINRLWYEVNTKTYEIGKSNCFIVKRPKIREVFAADFRDRVVHHIIMMRLEPLFEEEFIEDNYNCRKGKGTSYGIERLHKQIELITENYTKPCWIGKFDLCGFFMSIHKPTLWIMLEKFINEKYKGEDKDLLLYLVKKVVLHRPEKNCTRKSPKELWKKLPKNKSLFTCGADYGLPIGNLTSQCFANFYMHSFDVYMKNIFPYYGRYVDDFFVLTRNKNKILKNLNNIDKFLRTTLKLHLHPDKLYIQRYEYGIKFIGSVVKKGRIYIGNRTVGSMYTKIRFFNKRVCLDTLENFMQSMNSYFGFLKHYKTYNVKKRVTKLINKKWFKYLYINKKKTKVIIKKKYTEKYQMLEDMKKGIFMDKYLPLTDALISLKD